MRFLPTCLLISTVILTSCQNMDNPEAKARHEEMKQIISNYDEKATVRQSEMEKKIAAQEIVIAELKKLVEETQKDLKEWNSAKNLDSVQAALSLKDIPNTTVSRSVMTILGQLKGPAAEKGIVDIILSDKDSSNISSGLGILQNIGSERLREVCLKVLEKGDPKSMQYAFRYITPVAKNEDVEKIIKIADDFSTSSKDYNIRYCWQYMLKFFLDRGGKESVPVVLKAIKDFDKEGFSLMCWGGIIISKFGTAEQFADARKILDPHINNKNINLDSEISYYFRENSRKELIPIMNVLVDKANGSYRRYFIEGFSNLSHPAAAAKLVNEYSTTKDSSTKSMLEKSFQGGYPGIMWFEEKKEAKLVPEKELEKMIENFDKK